MAAVRSVAVVVIAAALVLSGTVGYVGPGAGTSVSTSETADSSTAYPGQTVSVVNVSVASEDEQLIQGDLEQGSKIEPFGNLSDYGYINDDTNQDTFDEGDDLLEVFGERNIESSQLEIHQFNDSVVYLDDPIESVDHDPNKYNQFDDIYFVDEIVDSAYIRDSGTEYTTFQSTERYLTLNSSQNTYRKEYPIIKTKNQELQSSESILRDGTSGILEGVPGNYQHYNDDFGHDGYDADDDLSYGEPIYKSGGDELVDEGDQRLTNVKVFSGISDQDITTINLHQKSKSKVETDDADTGVKLTDLPNELSVNEIDPDGDQNSAEGTFGSEDFIIIDTTQNGQYDKTDDIVIQGNPTDGTQYTTADINGTWKLGSDSNLNDLVVFDKGDNEGETSDDLLIQKGELRIDRADSYGNTVNLKYWNNDKSDRFIPERESVYFDVSEGSEDSSYVTTDDFRLTHFEVEYNEGTNVSSTDMDNGVELSNFEPEELYFDDDRDGELSNGEAIIRSYDENIDSDDEIIVKGSIKKSSNEFSTSGSEMLLHYGDNAYSGREPIVSLESRFGNSSGEYNTNSLSSGEVTELNSFKSEKGKFEGFDSSTGEFEDGNNVVRLDWFEKTSDSIKDPETSSPLLINQFDTAVRADMTDGGYHDGEAIIEENDGRSEESHYGDTLTALTVRNDGTTPDEAIESVSLRRNGTEIATTSAQTDGVWTLEPSDSASFGTNSTTFEVTATLAADAPVDSTVDMTISDVEDNGASGEFDRGDRGLFFEDGPPAGDLGSGPTYTVADPDDIDATAVAYPDPGSDDPESGAIELAFTDALDPTTTAVDDFTVETIHGESVNVTGVDDDDDDERLVLSVEGTGVPASIATVDVEAGALSVASGAAVPERSIDVTTTGVTITEAEARPHVVYDGERVAVLANDGANGTPNHDEQLRIEGDTTGDGEVDDILGKRATGKGSLVGVIDTAEDNASKYRVTFESEDGSPGETVKFPVRNLSLGVTANRTNTTDVAGPIDASVAAAGSDRAIRAWLLDRDADNETVLDEQILTLDEDGEGTVAFPARVANVSIAVTDLGTGTENRTEPITVRKGFPGATFERDVVEEHRGDVAHIGLRLVDTRNATIRIGEEAVNYRETVTVVDGDGDGRATVTLNTHRAGSSDAGAGVGLRTDPRDRPAEETDRIVSVDRAFPPGKGLGEPLDIGAYPLEAVVDGDVTDVAELRVENRSTSGATTLVAPAGVDLDAASDVRNWTTPRKTVAVGDQAVVAVNASGLGGFLNESTDLRRGSNAAANTGAYVSVERGNPPPNRPARQLNVSNASTMVDRGEDSLYVVVPSGGDPYSIEAGEQFDATFVLNETSPYVGGSGSPDTIERESAETSVAFEPPAGRFADLDANETIDLPATANASIEGATNVAPGTNVTVSVVSDDENVTFRESDTEQVDADGTFDSDVDLESYPEGTEYTVVASANGDDITAVRTGQIVEGAIETDGAQTVAGSGGGGGGGGSGAQTRDDTGETEPTVTETRTPTTESDGDESVGERAAEFVTRDVPQFITTQATKIVVGLGIVAVLYGLLGLRRLTR